MATRTWSKDRADKRIASKIDALPLKDVVIKEYVKDMDLTGLANGTAYRVNGVHVYADILNLNDMLHVTGSEGETCHRRTLRFLNGSLGSKIASILARHGIQNFVLVDDDVFLPENLVRNDLDWRDVGQHKAEAVADRIGLIQPGAKVKAFRRSLGGQEASSDVEAVLSAVAATDLLIDATADPSAFNYLCSVQEFAKKPLLWGEVFGGGFGGLIARSRPEIDPDASTMRNRILAWCFEHGRSIPPAPGRYEGAGKIPEIAGDAEVTVIAGQLALMAVDTLIPRSPSAYLHLLLLV